MIQIQQKDGNQFKTDHINFITLHNIPCLEFWYTKEDGGRGKWEIPISRIDNLTSTAEESIQKLHKDVAEVLTETNNSINAIRDRLKDLV